MSKRTDAAGRAYKRSQLQIQIAVNRHASEFERDVVAALPTLAALNPRLTWCSPLEEDAFREYRDGALLDRLDRSDLRPALKRFWPARGPRWDALAVARDSNGAWLGPVLIEAKSYPAETRSKCAAADERRALIEQRLHETRRWLCVPERHAKWWTNGLYQAANRLTFLRFFRTVAGEFAWLATVYVVNDPDPTACTTRAKWDVALRRDAERLGAREGTVPDAGSVFIDGRVRSELLSPLG
jgi:hypothetical protein